MYRIISIFRTSTGRLFVAQRPQSLAIVRLCRARLVAHYQVPPVGQGHQKTRDGAQGYGEEFVVPDSGRYPLFAHKLGAAPGFETCKFD